jgi:uncharacterized protein (AIM24 family)
MVTLGRRAASARLSADAVHGVGADAGLLVLEVRGDEPGPRREFAVRLDGLRGYTGALQATVLERRGRGVAAGEAFGGVGSPLHRLSGSALIAVAPRPGRQIVTFTVEDAEPCFLREDAMLAFDLALAYENERMTRLADEPLSMVQLRGNGGVAIDVVSGWRALAATKARPAVVRGQALLGWSGRLATREIPLGEAPAGQRGLVELAGEGAVLVAGAFAPFTLGSTARGR